MLVLSRSNNESIMIGDEVEVTLLSISGNTVKIGITAPISVSVDRSEIYIARQRDMYLEIHAEEPMATG